MDRAAPGSYQVKTVQHFLALLKLLPLDDVLHVDGRVLAAGQLPVHLHELEEATAAGVEGSGVVASRAVLGPAQVVLVGLVLLPLPGPGLETPDGGSHRWVLVGACWRGGDPPSAPPCPSRAPCRRRTPPSPWRPSSGLRSGRLRRTRRRARRRRACCPGPPSSPARGEERVSSAHTEGRKTWAGLATFPWNGMPGL